MNLCRAADLTGVGGICCLRGFTVREMRIQGEEVVVGTAVKEAHGVVSRTRGLMFRRSLANGEGLDIRPCGSIHMMFMFFPIDAVFYDREFRVTKVARNLRPWIGLAFGGKGTRGVVELPVGAAAGVETGDVIEFSEAKQGSS
ncbi:MAG TPA: DUF192 domain-containing protein [Tepidiformaceae bacterium]|nr:DUF192 domain-containing protein [Tepidiformaceae bacterium]